MVPCGFDLNFSVTDYDQYHFLVGHVDVFLGEIFILLYFILSFFYIWGFDLLLSYNAQYSPIFLPGELYWACDFTNIFCHFVSHLFTCLMHGRLNFGKG